MYEDVKLSVKLRKDDWAHLRTFLDVPSGLTRELACEIRHNGTKSAATSDLMDMRYYDLGPCLSEAVEQYREDGLLLPYGIPRTDFDTPNPTFFDCYRAGKQLWPIEDEASALQGWKYED